MKKSISVKVSDDLDHHLRIVARKQNKHVGEVVRQAVREYLDKQDDIIGSRTYYHKTMRNHLDSVESRLTFQLHILLHALESLAKNHPTLLTDALIAAKTSDLDERITAVRDHKVK